MIDKIEIDGEVYVKASDIRERAEYKASPIQLVVLNCEWAAIGRVSELGDKTVIQNAALVRRKGNVKGLADLANRGRLLDTNLEFCPDITVNTSSIVLIMNCNQSKWIA